MAATTERPSFGDGGFKLPGGIRLIGVGNAALVTTGKDKATVAPDEFGAMCAFLCSQHAGFIVGQNILLDGGNVNATL